jgi:hypothetical protein
MAAGAIEIAVRSIARCVAELKHRGAPLIQGDRNVRVEHDHPLRGAVTRAALRQPGMPGSATFERKSSFQREGDS